MIELPKPLKGCDENKNTCGSFSSNEETSTCGNKGEEEEMGGEEVAVPATVIEEVQSEESNEEATKKPHRSRHPPLQVPETNHSKEEDDAEGEEGETEEEGSVRAEHVQDLRAAVGDGILIEFSEEAGIGDAEEWTEDDESDESCADAESEEIEGLPLSSDKEISPHNSERDKGDPIG